MVMQQRDRSKKQQWRAYSRTSLLARVALSMIVLLAASCHSKSKLPAPGSPGYTDYVSAFYTGLAGLQVGDDVRANGSLSQATTLCPASLRHGQTGASWRCGNATSMMQRRVCSTPSRSSRMMTALTICSDYSRQPAAIPHLRSPTIGSASHAIPATCVPCTVWPEKWNGREARIATPKCRSCLSSC